MSCYMFKEITMPNGQHYNLTSPTRTSVKSIYSVRIAALVFLVVQLALGGCAKKYLQPAALDPSDAVVIIRSSGMPIT